MKYQTAVGMLIAAIAIFSIVYIAIDDQKPATTTEIGSPPGDVEEVARIGKWISVIHIRLPDGTRCIALYREQLTFGGISCNWK